MKSNKAKLREASKKAARTKKSMQQARQETTDKAEPAKPRLRHARANAWPAYMKRALPNPQYGTNQK
jgi:hypothetical protein